MIPHFKANAHLHLPPNFSAFDTVDQVVELAAQQGVRVVGANNYYDYHVYGEFARLCNANGIYPLFGIEIIALLEDLVKAGIKINDPGNPGKMYVCGKGITRFEKMTAEATELLTTIRRNDSTRMAAMTAKLAAIFAAAGLETGLDAEAVKLQIVARHGSPLETVYLQERHIAQAFQEAIFAQIPSEERAVFLERLFGTPSKAKPDDAAALQNEIRSHLMKAGKPAFVPETFVGFDHARRLILALGGIPCYPVLIDGASPICPYEADIDALISANRERGIFCTEFIPVRNTPEVLTRYVLAMRRAGFVVTAGTEHNTRDLIPIAPTCLNGEPIPAEIDAIFREGACVVAAHQHLTRNGKPGFVDSDGLPNSGYPDAETRITAFAKLGAELISAEMRDPSLSAMPIQTQTLKLVPITLEEVRAMVESMDAADKSQLSADWLARLHASISADIWTHGFSLVHQDSGVVVGKSGFKGHPTADGVVEIAYGIVPDYQGKGYATEAAQALVAFAFNSGRVRVVQAHTLPEPNASTRVLTKCGFRYTGEVIDPEDGLVWRWEKHNEDP